MKDYFSVLCETMYEMRVMSVLGLGIPLCIIFGTDIVGFFG